MLTDDWLIFSDIDKLSKKLADDILSIAEHSIKLNNKFLIVLAGGNSVENVYKILENSDSDWNKWYLFIGDERCLPLKSQYRNDQMINNVWLNNGKIPKQNINFIHAELGANQGALNYERKLKYIGDFDVVLLGIGEDVHTASLFPGCLYDESKSVVVEFNSPKFPKNRISMSYLRLNQSKKIFKVISGSSKKKAVQLWLEGSDLPISKIYGHSEKVYVCKDVLTV